MRCGADPTVAQCRPGAAAGGEGHGADDAVLSHSRDHDGGHRHLLHAVLPRRGQHARRGTSRGFWWHLSKPVCWGPSLEVVPETFSWLGAWRGWLERTLNPCDHSLVSQPAALRHACPACDIITTILVPDMPTHAEFQPPPASGAATFPPRLSTAWITRTHSPGELHATAIRIPHPAASVAECTGTREHDNVSGSCLALCRRHGVTPAAHTRCDPGGGGMPVGAQAGKALSASHASASSQMRGVGAGAV